jgi:PAS domain S-box-containing protein
MDIPSLRILLVEDDEDDYLLTRDLLSEIQGEPFQLDWVRDYDAALEAMGLSRHEVYLLDYRLGPRNGLELLRQALASDCKAPIILLTGQGEREVDIEAMKAGAADYLTKGQIDAALLERSIRYAVERQRDREALRQARDDLERRVQERTAELERANAALRQSEEQSRRLLQVHEAVTSNMGEGLYAIDTQGLVTYMNPAAENLLGWKGAELLGRRMHDMTHYKHPDGSPFPIEECAGFRVLHEGKVLKDHDDVFIKKDGTFFPVVYSSSPLVCDGKVAGLVVVFRDVSERKRAEEALRQQREWSRVTLSSIGDGVIATDPTGRVTFLNLVAQALTGWTQAEAAGKPLGSVFHILNEQTREPVENPVQKVVREGKVIGLANHTILIARDGIERSIDDSAAPIRDSQGEMIGVVLIFRDVTERRKAERMLRRQANLLEQTHDAIFVWEFPGGRIDYWSRAAEQLYGIPKQDALGKASHDLLQTAFPQGSAAAFESALERQGQWKGELAHTTQGGQQITVEAHLRLMQEADGKRLVLQTSHDVTERKRAEEALRDSEARFRQLADAMPQIVWTARPDGFLDYFNRRWFEYTGFTEGQTFSPEGWNPILYPDDVAASHQKWAWAVQTGEPYQIEYRFKDRRTGGYRWHLGRAIPVRDELGHIVRWFGTCTDIDDQKRAEEALRQADYHKDEFLAMLAHELRNPLAPIRNGLHILRTSKVDPQAAERIQSMMEQQVRNLTRLVDDLLDVSRITRGKIQLRKEPADLATVVGHAVETARGLIELQKHELSVSLPQEPVHLEADVTRLEQILTNLLNNAAKYTEPGGHIWLTAGRDHSEVVVRVRDNGIGIPDKLFPHIFDMFTQADRTLDRSQGGLGIGLTLVRRLVEMHGGSVLAHSDGPGKGSEFMVRLPALPPRQPDVPGQLEQEPAKQEPLRILVVEDEVAVEEMLVMLLELWGHTVRAVHDGPAALAAAETFHPEVVLCDIGLPGMNGYQLARQLGLQAGPNKPVLVAITGYGQEEDRRRAQTAGFDHHMTKPVDPAALEALLAHCPSTVSV